MLEAAVARVFAAADQYDPAWWEVGALALLGADALREDHWEAARQRDTWPSKRTLHRAGCAKSPPGAAPAGQHSLARVLMRASWERWSYCECVGLERSSEPALQRLRRDLVAGNAGYQLHRGQRCAIRLREAVGHSARSQGLTEARALLDEIECQLGGVGISAALHSSGPGWMRPVREVLASQLRALISRELGEVSPEWLEGHVARGAEVGLMEEALGVRGQARVLVWLPITVTHSLVLRACHERALWRGVCGWIVSSTASEAALWLRSGIVGMSQVSTEVELDADSLEVVDGLLGTSTLAEAIEAANACLVVSPASYERVRVPLAPEVVG